MRTDTKKVVIAFAVIAALCLAAVWWLSDFNDITHRKETTDIPVGGVTLQHERASVPVAMVLASNRVPRGGCDKSCLRDRNRVDRWKKETTPIGTAWMESPLLRGQGCMGKKTANAGFNEAMNEVVFTLWQTTQFCWQTPTNKPGNFNAYNTNRGTTRGTTAWWNYWQFTGWDNPADGGGINSDGWRYKYRRNSGSFETCFMGSCAFWYDHVHVSQTVRANGTFEDSIGH